MTHHNEQGPLNEAVNLFLAGVNPEMCPTVHSIIAQQAAIIEQQREEIAALAHDIVRSQQVNTDLLYETEQQREALGIARGVISYFLSCRMAVHGDKWCGWCHSAGSDVVNRPALNNGVKPAQEALTAIDNVMKGA